MNELLDQPVLPGIECSTSPQSATTANWWKAGDAALLLLYSCTVVFTLRYHEKWADEAQAWLLARDLPLKTLWLRELRYEGSPGLWHTILWTAQHIFHVSYAAIGYIGASCAIAGVAALLYLTPFPRAIRWMLAFSYFLLYQYAVVARSYVLFAFFCFVAARQYRNQRNPAVFALCLVPLALLTAHGSLLAAGLALCFSVSFVKRWPEHTLASRRQFTYAAIALGWFYVCLFLLLRPAPDVEATHQQAITFHVAVHRLVRGVSGTLVDNAFLSSAILAIFVFWCYRRRSLATFLLPVTLMMALYIYADGWPHQLGTIFLAIIVGLAIAWPTDVEREHLGVFDKLAYRVMLMALVSTLGYQVYAAFYTIYRDVKLPYSGAQETAQYLKPLVAQGKQIDGYQYGMVAVNAFYDHNIFHNLSRAYYHHSVGEYDPISASNSMRTSHSDYMVITWWDDFDQQRFQDGLLQPLSVWGYSLAHVANGYLFTKTGYSHRQIYFVFRRNPSPPLR